MTFFSLNDEVLWQVTAYRHMICISPLCAISCLTHIYTVHFTLNTTHPHHIYLISGDQTKGRFCELRSGLVIPGPRWAWRSLITNLQLPETIEGEWVPIGFENQLSPLWKFGRGARDTFMKKKNINQEKFNETESGRTWITKDWRRGWIVRPPNTLSKRFSNKRKQPESEPSWV